MEPMEPIMACFDKWKTRHAGLFTFSQSQKHVALYQKFGFWPRFLTAIMSKPIGQTGRQVPWTRFSEVPVDERDRMLLACRDVTATIYDGLDVAQEVRAVAEQTLGETVLLWKDGKIAGLTVCHCGPRTEAGSGVSISNSRRCA
jgi:hypothetical protein